MHPVVPKWHLCMLSCLIQWEMFAKSDHHPEGWCKALSKARSGVFCCLCGLSPLPPKFLPKENQACLLAVQPVHQTCFPVTQHALCSLGTPRGGDQFVHARNKAARDRDTAN